MPAPSPVKIALGVHRVDALLLVHAADGSLRALDYASGRERWRIPGAGYGPPVVRGADVVRLPALRRSPAPSRSTPWPPAERRWSAVVPGATGDGYLGAPHTDPDRVRCRPSDIVLLRPSLNDYEVRDIVTGKVLRRWTATDEAVAVTGTTIVRSRADGTTWGVDATIRARALARAPAGCIRRSPPTRRARRSRSRAARCCSAASASSRPTSTPTSCVRSTRRADASADVPKRIEGDVTVVDGARVFTADGAVQADGRVYKTDGLPEAAATATQVGWETGRRRRGPRPPHGRAAS